MKSWLLIAALLTGWSFPVGAGPKVVKARYSGTPGAFIAFLSSDVVAADVDITARAITRRYGGEVTHVWENLRAFRYTSTDSAADSVAGDPRIGYVEQDLEFEMPTIEVSGNQWAYLNGEWMWHLDRLDELNWPPPNGMHNMLTEGRTVYAYLMDTGVRRSHDEFEPSLVNRVVATKDFSTDAGANNEDVTNACATILNPHPNWAHGTNTASVLAGTNVGAAKTKVVSLKVMRCGTGIITTTALMSALNWIRSSNDPFADQPAVINYSGYVPPWQTDANHTPAAFSNAVAGRVASTNIPFFTSADNHGTDSCAFSPNNKAYTKLSRPYGTVFVVAGSALGSDSTKDYRWQNYPINDNVRERGSNGGDCISIYAPATSIYLADPTGGVNTYVRRTGTSFSAPLAAAVAARYIERSRNETGWTPSYQEVYDFLLCKATKTIDDTYTPARKVCIDVTGSDRWVPAGDACAPAETPFSFVATTNTSAAMLLHWNEALGRACP